MSNRKYAPRIEIENDLEASQPSTATRIRIFPAAFERLNLFIGIAFLILTAFSVFVIGREPRKEYYGTYEAFIFNVIFLNITHTAFTAIFPLFAPKVQSWWKTSRVLGMRPLAAAAALFTLSVVSIYFVYSLPPTPTAKIAILVLTSIIDLWTTHHLLSQIHGLSRMYDHQTLAVVGPRSRRDSNLISSQRIVLSVLTACICIKNLLLAVYGREFASTMIFNSFTVIAIVCSIWSVTAAFYEVGSKRSNKTLFLLRTIPFGFLGYGYSWPFYACIGMHGIESLFISLMMMRNSNSLSPIQIGTRSFWLKAALSSVLLVGISYLFMMTRFRFHSLALLGEYEEMAIRLGLSIVVSWGFVHYLIEGAMFKMREPQTRQQLGPLLVTKTETR